MSDLVAQSVATRTYNLMIFSSNLWLRLVDLTEQSAAVLVSCYLMTNHLCISLLVIPFIRSWKFMFAVDENNYKRQFVLSTMQ